MTEDEAFALKFGYLTGSVAFGVSGPNSDIDYFIPSTAPKENNPFINYYKKIDERDHYPFASIRVDKLNFIISNSPEFDKRWLAAHSECMCAKDVFRKENRIKIFRKHLYEEGSECV